MKAPRFLLRGFRRPSEVASLALGRLERQVLDQAWQCDEVSVCDIYLAFEERIAYTTLMTTLDRLYKKRLLDRRKDGRSDARDVRQFTRQFDRRDRSGSERPMLRDRTGCRRRVQEFRIERKIFIANPRRSCAGRSSPGES